MAIVSSHILDSVAGTHAGGIRVELFCLHDDGTKELVFEVIANEEGRIAETIDIDNSNSTEQYELVFHTADYFPSPAMGSRQVMDLVVVRLTLDNPEARYHIPLVLSPHSYTIWWSS